MMRFLSVFLVFLVSSLALCEGATVGNIIVGGASPLYEVHEAFLGFTNDWWVADDPNFGKKWQNAGILTYNLSSPLLIELVRALAPATWRVGGSPEDTVIYEIGNPPECPRSHQGPYPDPMCLSMDRWEQITTFAKQTGVHLLFGLNGLYGRANKYARMNTTNAREFLKYTALKGYPVYAFELSNELGNGPEKDWRVYPQPLALDYGVIRSYINEFWPNASNRPLFIGPDCAPDQFVSEFLPLARQYINATTYHAYAGSGFNPDIAKDLMSAAYLDQADGQDTSAIQIGDKSAPGLEVWAGEVGPAYGGGAMDITNRFLDSFWYLDHLGTLAKIGVKRFLRSTLAGGDYELLNRTTGLPNPDYFAALLWKRTTNTRSLGVINNNFGSSSVRTYAMCSLEKKGSVTVLILNFDLTEVDATVTIRSTAVEDSIIISNEKKNENENENDVGAGVQLEYHVRSAGSPYSDTAEFQVSKDTWVPLQLTNGMLPKTVPIIQASNAVIRMAPFSYAFVVYPSAAASACYY